MYQALYVDSMTLIQPPDFDFQWFVVDEMFIYDANEQPRKQTFVTITTHERSDTSNK